MILKIIGFTFILFFISGCSSLGDCQQENALKFDEPIKSWVNVKCKDGVEYLAPEEGFIWLDVNGNEVRLFSDLSQIDDEELEGKNAGRYFERQVSRELAGRNEVINFNAFLAETFGEKFEFKDMFYSRVFTEANRMSYELVFYVDQEASSASYLTITVGNGSILEPVSYKIIKK